MSSYGIVTEEMRARMEEKKKKMPPIRLSSFVDPRQPWVLVPDGSLLGIFDWVPKKLRVGPWKPSAIILLAAVTGFVFQTRPSSFFYDSPSTLVSSHQELFSFYWWYNVIACICMTSLIIYVMITKSKAVVITYTIISWNFNAFRHGINALAPFLKDHHFLLQINRMLRFPALVTASTTVIIWNFVLLPYVLYGVLDTQQKKYDFIQWNLSFRMVQKHVCNIIYAILNTIVTGRSAEMVLNNNVHLFDFDDLWYGFAWSITYALFYILVLDRIGVHIYPIFSPRSNFALLTWVGMIISFYGQHVMWNKFMQNYVNSRSLEWLLFISCVLTVFSAAIATVLSWSRDSLKKKASLNKED